MDIMVLVPRKILVYISLRRPENDIRSSLTPGPSGYSGLKEDGGTPLLLGVRRVREN